MEEKITIRHSSFLPEYAWITNNHTDIDKYFCFSGYFGKHGPHVFAAGPVLVEALEAMISDAEDAAAFNKHQGYFDIAAERLARIKTARAALAKARGE